MIVDTVEVKCAIKILSMLDKDKSRYNEMFRITKVSHTTLQKVLKELEEKRFINKNEISSINTEYEINNKGKELLQQLIVISRLLS